MGLDMYLEADVLRTDNDPRAIAVFDTIAKHYPDGVKPEYSEEHGLALFNLRPTDKHLNAVRDAIAEQFRAVDTTNHWIGAEFNVDLITIPLGYWRKANQLHRWFINTVQGGRDECQRAEVSREQLFELRKLLKSVLANRDQAPELMPTQKGFFFGDTEYDDDYFDDLAHTLDILDRICDHGLTEKTRIYYHSSW